MSRLLRPQDTVARLQGDSFGIILLSETDPEAVAQLTQELVRALKAAISVGDRDIQLTASVGIAPPVDGGTAAGKPNPKKSKPADS